jgi:hypothetical protein
MSPLARFILSVGFFASSRKDFFALIWPVTALIHVGAIIGKWHIGE